MHQLELVGYRCVHDSATPRGEIAIINTCGFIGDAKEESIEMILQFAERKTKGKLRKLYVMGCLSQRYAPELIEEIPEVDGFFGRGTHNAVVRFQRQNGLSADGQVGKKTAAAMGVSLSGAISAALYQALNVQALEQEKVFPILRLQRNI